MYAMYDPLILGILGGVATLYSIGLCKSSNTKILNTLVTTDLAQPLHSHWDIREQISSGSELNQVSQRQKCPRKETLHQIVLQVELTKLGDIMKGPLRNQPHIIGT